MQTIGYKLVDKNGSVISQWGGVWGQCPAIPTLLICPNGNQVHCPDLNVDYDGVRLVEWSMDQPKKFTIDSSVILDRLTDDEYLSILNAGQNNVKVARLIDDLRLRKEVDLESPKMVGAGQLLISLGLLSEVRIKEIFAPG